MIFFLPVWHDSKELQEAVRVESVQRELLVWPGTDVEPWVHVELEVMVVRLNLEQTRRPGPEQHVDVTASGLSDIISLDYLVNTEQLYFAVVM